jgi:nucleoside phosphorylase
VVSSRTVINRIVRQHRKLVGVDMEAYGVLLASELAPGPRPQAFCVKSISDFGDRKKGDAYQKYAAYTSASFLYEFALAHLGTPRKSPSESGVESEPGRIGSGHKSIEAGF